MKVEVVRSPRRRKTVQAREVGGVLRVSIPASFSAAEEQHWVAEMVRRIERRSATAGIDLARRARHLADRYGLGRPATIRWADNQEWRWGSCTPADGSVRISSRLAGEPSWVLDYVIVHELAHLDVAGHDAGFWRLVNRYPLAERARGYLIARGRTPGPADALDGAGWEAADPVDDAGPGAPPDHAAGPGDPVDEAGPAAPPGRAVGSPPAPPAGPAALPGRGVGSPPAPPAPTLLDGLDEPAAPAGASLGPPAGTAGAPTAAHHPWR